MKKCPMCEFIYEDEQSLCDMDGIVLIAASEPSTDPKVTTSDPAGVPAKSIRPGRRRSAVQVVAAVILGAVLFLVYLVTTNRARIDTSDHSATQVAADAPSVDSTARAPLTEPAASSSADTPVPSGSTESIKGDEAGSPNIKSPDPSSSKTEASKAKTESPKRKSQRENQNAGKPKVGEKTTSEKDSRVGSFLKKAGNILKKPFQR